MLYFYLMFGLGVFSIIVAVFLFIFMFTEKEYKLLDVGKIVGLFLFGALLLTVTLPSLKYVVFKQYDVVSSKCVIEIDSSGRSSEADFNMRDTDEIFTFKDIPELDAYGKAIPYYCKVTVTKDHKFEISYKIFDVKTRKLITTSN